MYYYVTFQTPRKKWSVALDESPIMFMINNDMNRDGVVIVCCFKISETEYKLCREFEVCSVTP